MDGSSPAGPAAGPAKSKEIRQNEKEKLPAIKKYRESVAQSVVLYFL